MKTVLIVNSIDDSITQKRIEIFKNSPLVSNYKIYHAFATRDLDVELTLNELVFKLNLPIKDYKPDIIVFHTGAAFYEQPQIFRETVIELKKQYPSIKFCYEPKNILECHKYFDSLNEFTRDKETSEIVGLLFFKIFNREIPAESWIQQQF